MATQEISSSFLVDSRSTTGDFKAWLKTVPDTARLSVQVISGDRPWDTRVEKIIARWTQSVGG
jgi:hypothetical protein